MKAFQRILIAVVVLIVGVPVVAVVGFSIWWHHVTTGPDVREVTRSAEFQQQRAGTVAILEQTLGAFVSTAPKGIRLATSVRDRCGNESSFFGERPQMSCQRDIVVYLAFDGNPAATQRTWDKSLAAVHWRPAPEYHGDTYRQYHYEFVDSPPVRLTWSTRPKAPEPIGDFEKGLPSAYRDAISLEDQPVDVAKVYQDGYAAHRYIAELSAGSQYYPQSPKAPRSPDPTPSPTWNGCYGGHGDCPGG